MQPPAVKDHVAPAVSQPLTAARVALTAAPMPPYTDRDSKARAIAARFAPILSGSVLDVGCDQARLRQLVACPQRYTGVDMTPGAADVVLDLDSAGGLLPFDDGSFDAAVCTDVLEHLERCHTVIDELCRVSKRWALVSLPNPLRSLIDALLDRNYCDWKHYGLPSERPVDRHRWFFSAAGAERFVRDAATRNGFTIAELIFESVGAYDARDNQGRQFLDEPAVARGTLWAVLERSDNAGRNETMASSS